MFRDVIRQPQEASPRPSWGSSGPITWHAFSKTAGLSLWWCPKSWVCVGGCGPGSSTEAQNTLLWLPLLPPVESAGSR